MQHIIVCSRTKEYVHGFDSNYQLVVFCKNLCGAEEFSSKHIAEKVAVKLSSVLKGRLLEVKPKAAVDVVNFCNVVQSLV